MSAASVAVAQTPFVPDVAVDGTCPTPEAVETVLRSLLPATQPSGAPAHATVVDRGDSFVVSVDSRTKTYSDLDRNCVQRARIAAAFIALALGPPPLALENEPPAPPSPKPPLSSQDYALTAGRSKPRAWLHFGVRGAIQVSSPLGLTTPGVAFDVAAGWGSFGAEAMCAWLANADVSPSRGGVVSLQRTACAVGPMTRFFVASPVETDLKVGLALGTLRADGQGFATSHGSLRLEVGARLAFDASLRLSQGARVSPTAGLEITYYPLPYDLVVSPRGVVARTSTVWAGATAGVRWNAL